MKKYKKGASIKALILVPLLNSVRSRERSQVSLATPLPPDFGREKPQKYGPYFAFVAFCFATKIREMRFLAVPGRSEVRAPRIEISRNKSIGSESVEGLIIARFG